MKENSHVWALLAEIYTLVWQWISDRYIENHAKEKTDAIINFRKDRKLYKKDILKSYIKKEKLYKRKLYKKDIKNYIIAQGSAVNIYMVIVM